MPHVVIVTGPPGSGKSSVAEALCERYDRTVHIEGDAFFGFIRMGLVKPWLPESDHQNRMIARAIARAAATYARELYAVFIDAIVGPHTLPIFAEELSESGVQLHLALLRPSLEVTVRRGLTREPTVRLPEAQLRQMHAWYVALGDFAGCTFDNSDLSADQTADLVMDAVGRGDCLLPVQG